MIETSTPHAGPSECERIRTWLSARHDGELPEGTEPGWRQHLERCADCRCFEKSLEAISARLAVLRSASAPALGQDLIERFGAVEPLRRSSGITSWGLRIAAGLVGFAGFQLVDGRFSEGETPRNQAATRPEATVLETLLAAHLHDPHGGQAAPEHAPPEYALLMQIQRNLGAHR